jgi:hypothetical protein
MKNDKRACLLDELEDLLTRQIASARRNRLGDVETLGSRAEAVVDKVKAAGVLELPEFRDKRKRLAALYRNLHMALTSQKADVAEQLRRVRGGRKAVKAYADNMRS